MFCQHILIIIWRHSYHCYPKSKTNPIWCKRQHSIFWTASHFGCLDYIIDVSKAQRSHIKITYYFIATLDIYDIYIEVKYFWYLSLVLDVMLFLGSLEYHQECWLCVRNWDFLFLFLRLDKICPIDTGFDK